MESKRIFDVRLALGGVLLSGICCLIEPLQLYLSNREALEAALCPVVRDLLVFFACGTALSVILAWYCPMRLRKGVLIGLLAFALYEYLENGLLSMNYPPLNGDYSYFGNVVMKTIDTAVLVLVILVVWLLRRYVAYVGLAVLVLTVASLFDSHKSKEEFSAPELPVRFRHASAVMKGATFSSERNVVVLVLDSISSELAVDVLNRDTELAGKFAGFVCYTNNVGMCDGTVPAVAGICTGKYCEDESQLNRYAFTCFGKESFVADYVNAKATVHFAPGSYQFGFTTRQQVEDDPSPTAGPVGAFRRMRDQQQWNLVELSLFKLTPFIFKKTVYRHIVRRWDPTADYTRESWCYDHLMRAPIEAVPLCLQFWHTGGTHPPVRFDRNGCPTSQPGTDYGAALEQTWFVLRTVGKLLDSLKVRGIYDKTYLVITSDHGTGDSFARVRGSVGFHIRPMLLIKAFGDHGSLTLSAAPTGHSHLAALMRRLVREDVDCASTEKMLRAAQQVHRCRVGETYRDTIVSDQGKIHIRETPAYPDPKRLSTIRMNHRYSTKADNLTDPPPIFMMNSHYWEATSARVLDQGNGSRLVFRVEQPGSEVTLHIGVTYMAARAGGTMKMFDARNEKSAVIFTGIGEADGIERRPIRLRADADGFCEVRFDITQAPAHVYDLEVTR